MDINNNNNPAPQQTECIVHLKSGQSFAPILDPLRIFPPLSLSELKTVVSSYLGDTPSPSEIVLARAEGGGLVELKEGDVRTMETEATFFVYSTTSWEAQGGLPAVTPKPSQNSGIHSKRDYHIRSSSGPLPGRSGAASSLRLSDSGVRARGDVSSHQRLVDLGELQRLNNQPEAQLGVLKQDLHFLFEYYKVKPLPDLTWSDALRHAKSTVLRAVLLLEQNVLVYPNVVPCGTQSRFFAIQTYEVCDFLRAVFGSFHPQRPAQIKDRKCLIYNGAPDKVKDSFDGVFTAKDGSPDLVLCGTDYPDIVLCAWSRILNCGDTWWAKLWNRALETSQRFRFFLYLPKNDVPDEVLAWRKEVERFPGETVGIVQVTTDAIRVLEAILLDRVKCSDLKAFRDLEEGSSLKLPLFSSIQSVEEFVELLLYCPPLPFSPDVFLDLERLVSDCTFETHKVVRACDIINNLVTELRTRSNVLRPLFLRDWLTPPWNHITRFRSVWSPKSSWFDELVHDAETTLDAKYLKGSAFSGDSARVFIHFDRACMYRAFKRWKTLSKNGNNMGEARYILLKDADELPLYECFGDYAVFLYDGKEYFARLAKHSECQFSSVAISMEDDLDPQFSFFLVASVGATEFGLLWEVTWNRATPFGHFQEREEAYQIRDLIARYSIPSLLDLASTDDVSRFEEGFTTLGINAKALDLSLFAKNGFINVIEFLVGKGAPTRTVDLTGAARRGHKHVLKFFLERDADVSKVDLHGAIINNHKEVVKYLVEMKADLTPLAQVLIDKGDPDMILLLFGLENERRPNLQHIRIPEPVLRSKEIVLKLIEARADVNQFVGETSLSGYYARLSDGEMVKELVRKGAHVSPALCEAISNDADAELFGELLARECMVPAKLEPYDDVPNLGRNKWRFADLRIYVEWGNQVFELPNNTCHSVARITYHLVELYPLAVPGTHFVNLQAEKITDFDFSKAQGRFTEPVVLRLAKGTTLLPKFSSMRKWLRSKVEEQFPKVSQALSRIKWTFDVPKDISHLSQVLCDLFEDHVGSLALRLVLAKDADSFSSLAEQVCDHLDPTVPGLRESLRRLKGHRMLPLQLLSMCNSLIPAEKVLFQIASKLWELRGKGFVSKELKEMIGDISSISPVVKAMCERSLEALVDYCKRIGVIKALTLSSSDKRPVIQCQIDPPLRLPYLSLVQITSGLKHSSGVLFREGWVVTDAVIISPQAAVSVPGFTHCFSLDACEIFFAHPFAFFNVRDILSFPKDRVAQTFSLSELRTVHMKEPQFAFYLEGSSSCPKKITYAEFFSKQFKTLALISDAREIPTGIRLHSKNYPPEWIFANREEDLFSPFRFASPFPLTHVTRHLEALRLALTAAKENLLMVDTVCDWITSSLDYVDETERLKFIDTALEFGHWAMETDKGAATKLISLLSTEHATGLNALEEVQRVEGELRGEVVDMSHSFLKTFALDLQCRASLHTLILSGNSLSELPESIGELALLQVLRLDDNRLFLLPESLSLLQRLSVLSVKNNFLVDLPNGLLFLPSLSHFVCSDNLLSSCAASPHVLVEANGCFHPSATRLKPCFVSDFCWRELPKARLGAQFHSLCELHKELGEFVLQLLHGRMAALVRIICILRDGVSSQWLQCTMLWMQRIDLLLALSLCLETVNTIKLIRKLQDASSEEYVKVNLLNPQVMESLECVDDAIAVTPEPIPKGYREYEALDGAILYLPTDVSCSLVSGSLKDPTGGKESGGGEESGSDEGSGTEEDSFGDRRKDKRKKKPLNSGDHENTQSESSDLPDGNVALCIGASGTPGSATLKSPRNDAFDVALLLKASGWAVHLRLNKNWQEVMSVLTELKRTKPGTLLVYFSGHGCQVKGRTILGFGLKDEVLHFEEVYSLRSYCRELILIVDACRSGVLANSLWNKQPERVTLVRACGNGPAFDGQDEYDWSQFSKAVISYLLRGQSNISTIVQMIQRDWSNRPVSERPKFVCTDPDHEEQSSFSIDVPAHDFFRLHSQQRQLAGFVQTDGDIFGYFPGVPHPHGHKIRWETERLRVLIDD